MRPTLARQRRADRSDNRCKSALIIGAKPSLVSPRATQIERQLEKKFLGAAHLLVVVVVRGDCGRCGGGCSGGGGGHEVGGSAASAGEAVGAEEVGQKWRVRRLHTRDGHRHRGRVGDEAR